MIFQSRLSPKWPIFIGFVAFLSHVACLQAQTPYFQQEVNYKIVVALDDQKHILSGDIEIEYTNHAPNALPEIWMHLWGNAFKNSKTAFCSQKLREGDTRFYFAPDSMLGSYKNLDFTVDGQKVTWCFDPENPDIAQLNLSKPLLPGARVTIRTPFALKIPDSFSRLGHVGTSYQMTQWFPKPAVYDRLGWHAIPYLDIGEFYSEFGNFDVTITLPSNYVVGATGVCQTASEIEFLNQKVTESLEKLAKGVDSKHDDFPTSSKTLKTIRYKAEKVHDFAWFADKRFMVLRDTAHLASGRMVDCWAMFTNSSADIWKKGAFYVRRSIEFYSNTVGEYPWPHATAVHSALSAGGGMEYPMITVIGDESSSKGLDDVITHEIGHNWFYGILASNERDHPFMDEGINTYYEQRYMKKYYGGGGLSDDYELPKWIYDPKLYGSIIESGYLLLAHEKQDIPPDSHSNNFTGFAYGEQVYMKTALTMAWLEKAIGTEKFDAGMRAYYQKWKFKHPYPEDLREAWAGVGLKADWWFKTIQTQSYTDYALTKVRKTDTGFQLTVQNKGDFDAPFPVTALKNGQAQQTVWYPAQATKKQTLDFPTKDADAFVLDYDRTTLDLNRQNNTQRVNGLFPGIEPLRVKILAPFRIAKSTTLGVLPWFGWNDYDKTMLGAVFYSPPAPGARFQYYLAPGYGLGSKRFVGLGDLRLNTFPGGIVPKMVFGLSAKQFDYDYNASEDGTRYTRPFAYYLKYNRIVPQIRIVLRDKSLSFRHQLILRALFINKESANFLRDYSKYDLIPIPGGFDTLYSYARFSNLKTNKSKIFELRYEAVQKKMPNPYQMAVALETQPDYTNLFGKKGSYVKSTFEWRQQFYYAQKKKVAARLFVGAFLQNTNRNSAIEPVALSLNPQGFNDYRFDQLMFGRSAQSGFAAKQITQTDGGFKSAFGSAEAGNIGNSNNFVLALNLKADLPRRLPLGIPLKPWFDIGYFDDATKIGKDRAFKEQLLWSGGFMLEFWKGGLEIYFPLVNSTVLRDAYRREGGGSNPSALFGGGNYFKWISWSIRIPFREPGEMIESFIR
ncbi:MAG: M1 family metallopeptidase [Bacteroidota bacterium]